MKTMHENQYVSLNGYKMLLLWLTKIARVHEQKSTKGSPPASTKNVVQVVALITHRERCTGIMINLCIYQSDHTFG
jgi:hypothetical protein